MIAAAEAGIDWWARALGLVGVISLGWNVYTWRRTNRVSLRVRSMYTHNRDVVSLTISNRGATSVTVTDVRRQIRSRPVGRRFGGWHWQEDQASRIEWTLTADETALFPFDIAAGDRRTINGRDRVMEETATRMMAPPDFQWTFRVVLDDNRRFRSRVSPRRSYDGKLQRPWSRVSHRVPSSY